MQKCSYRTIHLLFWYANPINALFNTFNIIRKKIGSNNNFLCKYSTKQLSPPQFSGNSRSELTNIDEKACNNIPETVKQKLALSARLGHSSQTDWNKHDSSYYYKQQFYHRETFHYIIYKYMIHEDIWGIYRYQRRNCFIIYDTI